MSVPSSEKALDPVQDVLAARPLKVNPKMSTIIHGERMENSPSYPGLFGA